MSGRKICAVQTDSVVLQCVIFGRIEGRSSTVKNSAEDVCMCFFEHRIFQNFVGHLQLHFLRFPLPKHISFQCRTTTVRFSHPRGNATTPGSRRRPAGTSQSAFLSATGGGAANVEAVGEATNADGLTPPRRSQQTQTMVERRGTRVGTREGGRV